MYAETAISRKSFAAQCTTVIFIIILLLAALPASIVSAAETNFYPPSVATTVGQNTWVNPTFVFFSDNQYASASVNKVLRVSRFNILAIPGDASIDGIAFTVEGYTGGTRQVKVQISGNNGVTWSPALVTDLTHIDGVHTLGGPTSLWGLSWTASQFTNASFVARITPVGTKSSGTVFVDQVRVKVYYTPNAIPLTVQADPQTKHYGYPEPQYTYQVTSGALLPGDSFSGALGRAPGELPGQYEINQGTLTAGPGYLITFVPDFLTIDKAPLTVTAQSYWKLSSDPDITTFGYSYTGFVLGEDETALSALPACSLPAGTDQTVDGTYPITCSGAAADNYDISYADGALTVKTFNNTPGDVTLTPGAVEENHLAGTTVGTLGTDDPDPDPFTYSFCGGADDASFQIDGSTLKTSAAFNFEARSSYDICVQVDDHFHGTFQKPLTVTVLDLPETFTSRPLYDGWVLESSETSGKGSSLSTADFLMVGDDAADRQYRSILAFSTGGIPDGAVITSAVIKIKQYTIVGTNPFTTHGNILVDARKGAFSGNLSLEAHDFEALATKDTATLIRNLPVNGWYKGTLPAASLTLVNKAGPTEFRLRFKLDDNNDNGADLIKFFSGNSILANKPVLVVTYYIP
jgi:hypothetical protein